MGFFRDIAITPVAGREPKPLFGGQIQNVQTLSPEQERLFGGLSSFLSSRDLEGLRDSPAPLSATGPTNLANLSLEALEQQALQLTEGGGAAGSVQQGRDALTDIIGRGPRDTSDFFKTTVQDPALEAFSRDVLPAIGRNFGGNQFFGSERREADSRAREDLIDSLTRTRSQVSFDERQRDTENTLAAIGQTGALESITPDVIAKLLGTGEIARGQETELLGAEREEELRQRAEKDKVIEQILAALGIQTTENVAFPPVFSGGSSGDAGGVVGGIASFFSDRRLKRDITLLGVLQSIPIYIFRYLWSDDWNIGPMAQDLQVTHPGMVHEINGVLMVDATILSWRS